MKDKALNLLGMMRRANAIAPGEDNTCEAVRAGKAKLLLLAADASANACHRAENLTVGHNAELVKLPFTKEEISSHVGTGGCSMAAVTDLGFACALMKLLTAIDPVYAPQEKTVTERRDKAERRRIKTQAEGKKNAGKRRTNA